MKKLLIIANLMLVITIYGQTLPHDMVSQMGRGINLGNVFSAPVEGNWSPVVYPQYFLDVANEGFTNVRIPIDFFGTRTTGDTSGYSSSIGTSGSYTGTPADYIVDVTYLDRIEEVIDWALSAGLTVTLDFHGQTLKDEFIYTFDSGKSQYTNPTSAKRVADNEKFRAIWSQVANRFKNHSYNLLFEIINEPYFHMSAADMNTLNTDLIAVIRSTGANNLDRNIIIVGGGETSHEAPLQIDPLIISNDNYLIATFHYYQPFNFTSSSGDTRDNEDWGTTSDKNTLVAEFDEVSNWASANNIPVFVGEFGADNTGGYKYSTGDLNTVGNNATGFADGGPDNASRVEYHRFIAEQSINRGFSFAAWDSGPKSNKTIHMRKDNSSSVNYDINYFSVNSYNPKNTNVSTVVDNSIWVEDVKNALLGTTSNCDNSIPNLIVNKNFECGFNDNWDVWFGGIASGDFSDATSDAHSGTVGAKIEVTQEDVLNKVLLRNQVFTENIVGKKIKITFYAKASTSNQKIKARFKAVIDGSNSFPSSDEINLTTNYPTVPYQFIYNVPANTTSLQFQVMCGEDPGIYYFDDFDFSIISEHTSIQDGSWDNASTWDSGEVPTSSDIVNVNHNVTKTGDLTVSDLNVESGKSLIVTGNLGVTGNAILNSTSTTFSSLLVSGSVIGNVEYKRHTALIYNSTTSPTGTNDLIAAPLSGEQFNSFATNNTNLATNGSTTAAFAIFDNGIDNQYENFDTSSTTLLSAGTGYRAGTTDGGSLLFSGSVNTSLITVPIAVGSGSEWNLIGNPYPSYLNVKDFLNHTANQNLLDQDAVGIYGYDGDASDNWTIYNLANTMSSDPLITPGQGFFVAAETSGDIEFTPTMRRVGNTDDFIPLSINNPVNNVVANLSLTKGGANYSTAIYFIDNMSKGLDAGYDTKAFQGNSSGIFTHLLEDNLGVEMAIQSLPYSDYNSSIVPLGIKVNAGEQFTISLNNTINTTPFGVNVYLEDVVEGTFTLLNTLDYVHTSSEELNSTGRFFVHFTTEVLSGTEFTNSEIQIFANHSNNTIEINGLLDAYGSSQIEVRDIHGRLVLQQELNGSLISNVISVEGLNSGVYIIQLSSNNNSMVKKVILK